jgi:type IX secretion system PorP/SprF family membrane protein
MFALLKESNRPIMRNFYYLPIVALLIALLPCPKASAQDIHFSQFFEAPLLRNPSLAGLFDGDIRMQGVYRDQWGSVTFNMEYKQPIGHENDFITTGLQLVYDKAGSTNFTTTNILPAINYHKALSAERNKYLSLGFMGGLVQRRIDRSKITTNNHFDGNGYNPGLPDGESFTNANYSYMDGSVGMSFNSAMGDRLTDNYFIGLAYHHFNRPKNSFYNNPTVELNPKWVVSAGARFTLNEFSFFTLQADHNVQGNYQETIGGATFSYKIGEDMDRPNYTLHMGAYMRWKDALIPVIKLDYNPFSIAMSYDVNVSELKTASQGRGGMELSITYAGFFDRDNSSKNAVRCPRF